MQALSAKRDRFLRDAFYKISHHIRREAERRGITKLILGLNPDWKQKPGMRHKNNQTFVSLPLAKFADTLKLVLSRAGVEVVVREESYTSKASFLDNDEIPTYRKGDTEKHTFSGKRVKRGLYRSKDGTQLNADVNGACNTGRKEDPGLFAEVKDFSYLWKSVRALNFGSLYKVSSPASGKTKRREAKGWRKMNTAGRRARRARRIAMAKAAAARASA